MTPKQLFVYDWLTKKRILTRAECLRDGDICFEIYLWRLETFEDPRVVKALGILEGITGQRGAIIKATSSFKQKTKKLFFFCRNNLGGKKKEAYRRQFANIIVPKLLKMNYELSSRMTRGGSYCMQVRTVSFFEAGERFPKWDDCLEISFQTKNMADSPEASACLLSNMPIPIWLEIDDTV